MTLSNNMNWLKRVKKYLLHCLEVKTVSWLFMHLKIKIIIKINFLINLYSNKYKIITMITADLCIIPMGIEETGLGEYVAKAVQIIEESGLNYQLTAMGTQIESNDLKQLYAVCASVQEAIFEMGVPRVYTVLKIDDRRDKENRTLEEKVKSVKNRMWKIRKIK